MPRPAPARPADRLRRATRRDLPLLVRHREAMFREIGPATPAALRLHGRVYARWVRPLWARGEMIGCIVEHGNDGPVASGCLWFQPTQPRVGMPRPRTPYLLSMYTDPAHRGRGLATRIVRRLLAEARRRGYARVTLHASEQGRGVYRRLGFEPTSEMRRWLDPRVARRFPPPRRRP